MGSRSFHWKPDDQRALRDADRITGPELCKDWIDKTTVTLNDLPGRGRLNEWLYTLPGPVLSAAVTSALSSANRKAKTTCNPYAAVAPSVDTKSTGRSFQAMAQTAIDKIPSGPQLDALTAEKVFGWKNVYKHEGSLVGKNQDKATSTG